MSGMDKCLDWWNQGYRDGYLGTANTFLIDETTDPFDTGTESHSWYNKGWIVGNTKRRVEMLDAGMEE